MPNRWADASPEASLKRHLQAAQNRRTYRRIQGYDSELPFELASSSGVPIRGRSSTTSSSRSRSRSRRHTPYQRQQSTPEDPVLVERRRLAEAERLDLELKEVSLKKVQQLAAEEQAQAELLESRIRRLKAQKELEELEKL